MLPERFRKDLDASGTPPALQGMLLVMLRWVAPPVVAIGLVLSVLDLVKA